MENVLAKQERKAIDGILESIKDFCDECTVDVPGDCVPCYLNQWREKAGE